MLSGEYDDAAAGRLPQSLGDLTAGLESLVRLGDEFAQRSPQESQAGVWWWGAAADQLRRLASGQAPHREASVLVLFWPGADGPQVLLTERSPQMTKHPGQIAFPGGGAETADSGPAATAVREAQEETGLDPGRLRVLGALPPAPIPISGFNVTPVVAVAEDPGELVPQTGEVSRVLKLPVAALARPEHRYTAVVVHRGPRLPSPAFLRVPADGGGHSTAEAGAEALRHSGPGQGIPLRSRSVEAEDSFFIWGFTGTLLDRMLQRLGWAGQWDRSREIDPRAFRRR